MNPIDRLCELLDERGVKYERVASGSLKWVRWKGVGGLEFSAIRSNREPDMLYFNDACVSPEVAVKVTLGETVTGDTSDGYHTFNELYHHRAILFSVIVHDHGDLAWKAKAHHDGTMYDGMFIVGIETPEGQATYHYDIDPYWDMFECKEVDRAPEWDGHTPDDAIARIATLCVSDATLARQGDADLKAENAKLRALATRFADYVGQDRCEGCVIKTRCNEGLIDECWLLTEIREIADGLGIEVER